MQKITPCLWFDRSTEEAMNFYTSTFSNSRIISIERYPEGLPEPFVEGMQGQVWSGIFEVEGYRFMALDGGPLFSINPSISFFINCNSKEKVDRLWEALSKGGEALMPLDKYPFSEWYGWIQDRFGVSWQLMLVEGDIEQVVIPSFLFVGDQCGRAEEAINYYTSIFNQSKAVNIMHYEANPGPDKPGTVMYAEFVLANQHFVAMDSALEHKFAFNEAISLSVECEDQAEVDYFWALSVGPEAEACGWLKDQFGISWQIVPKQLEELLSSPDREKADRAISAMLKMKKLDIVKLQAAFEG